MKSILILILSISAGVTQAGVASHPEMYKAKPVASAASASVIMITIPIPVIEFPKSAPVSASHAASQPRKK